MSYCNHTAVSRRLRKPNGRPSLFHAGQCFSSQHDAFLCVEDAVVYAQRSKERLIARPSEFGVACAYYYMSGPTSISAVESDPSGIVVAFVPIVRDHTLPLGLARME